MKGPLKGAFRVLLRVTVSGLFKALKGTFVEHLKGPFQGPKGSCPPFCTCDGVQIESLTIIGNIIYYLWKLLRKWKMLERSKLIEV